MLITVLVVRTREGMNTVNIQNSSSWLLVSLTPASEAVLLERITAHRLLLCKQTVLHARVLQAMEGVCSQGSLLPELGPTLLQPGDCDCVAEVGNVEISSLHAPVPLSTTKLFLALSTHLQRPIQNLFLLTLSHSMSAEWVAVDMTTGWHVLSQRKQRLRRQLGCWGDMRVGEVSGNSILKTDYSFKHTQKQKCAKLL